MRSIALVTDEESLPIDYDMPLLQSACRASGLVPEICDWEDPGVDWSRFDVVLLRSPWTYVKKLSEFLPWCEHVASSTQLCNPLSVVRWSLNKRYLADLTTAGVSVVPTAFFGPERSPQSALREFFSAQPGCKEIVVKPTVGAYSKDVKRFEAPGLAEAERHASRILDAGFHVMVQPYMESVDQLGETNLIYFNGVYSHAIHKSPMLMPDGTVNVPTFDSRRERVADESERAVAEAALDAAATHLQLKEPLVYARIDLIRDNEENPILLELELCEPSLNLPFTDGGAERFAQAVKEQLKR